MDATNKITRTKAFGILNNGKTNGNIAFIDKFTSLKFATFGIFQLGFLFSWMNYNLRQGPISLYCWPTAWMMTLGYLDSTQNEMNVKGGQ